MEEGEEGERGEVGAERDRNGVSDPRIAAALSTWSFFLLTR